jgi:cytochrome P450
MLHIVSQLSSRVFLGKELCRNPDWLRVTMDYTVDAINAAQELRVWPMMMRSWVHWFLPSCRKLRADLAECNDLVNPVLEKRRLDKESRAAQGLEPEEYLDAMEWMEQAAKGRPYDAAISQVMMAMAANFSGSDALTQILFDLCGHPKLVEDLREEIVSVMTENKWNKSTIYKLTLMDSVLKESQRIKPAAVGQYSPVYHSPGTPF